MHLKVGLIHQDAALECEAAVNYTVYDGEAEVQSQGGPVNECSCQMSINYKVFVGTMFVAGYLLPTISFIMSYTSVLVILQRSKLALQKTQTVKQPSNVNNRTVTMIISLMIVFIACYSPFQLYHLLRMADIYLSNDACRYFKLISET